MLRFATSPTGDMLIGSLRIAIVNFLISQQKNDQFLVRFEDTNTQKNIEGKDTEIMMTLEKFALKHDSVFHQSEHLNLYQTLALRLLKEKKAFICKCTDTLDSCYSGHCENLTQEDYTVIKASNQKFVLRLKKSKNTSSFVILYSDGKPSHNFASASDDMMSNIDLIIQEEKYLADMPKQIHIKNLLGYENKTKYIHLPVIESKEEVSVKWLFEEGFIPDAILNYLLLLDNSNPPKEIFTLPQAIEWFDLNSLSKSVKKFDITKLRFINREHLKLMDDKKLSTLFGFADADIGKLAKVYLDECSTTKELKEKIDAIFKPKDFLTKWEKEMKLLADIIAKAPYFETFDKLQEYLLAQSGLEEKKLYQILNYLLTGQENSPKLSEIYPFIKSYLLEVAS